MKFVSTRKNWFLGMLVSLLKVFQKYLVLPILLVTRQIQTKIYTQKDVHLFVLYL